MRLTQHEVLDPGNRVQLSHGVELGSVGGDGENISGTCHNGAASCLDVRLDDRGISISLKPNTVDAALLKGWAELVLRLENSDGCYAFDRRCGLGLRRCEDDLVRKVRDIGGQLCTCGSQGVRLGLQYGPGEGNEIASSSGSIEFRLSAFCRISMGISSAKPNLRRRSLVG